MVTQLCSTSEIAVPIPAFKLMWEAGSCLPLVSSLQHRILTNCMYSFSLWLGFSPQLPTRLGRLGDPGVSPSPGSGVWVVGYCWCSASRLRDVDW